MTPLRIASASVCIGAALAMISSTLAVPVSSAEHKIPRPPNCPYCRPALTFAGGASRFSSVAGSEFVPATNTG